MPRPNSRSAIITGTPLIAKRTMTQIGELPKLTCSASVGVPTEAWCSRCRRAKQQDLVVLVPLDEQDTVPDLSAAGRIQAEPAIEGVTVEFCSSS
jgi:hypothetical protein